MTRLRQLRDILRAERLDGLLITNPDNRFFVSGYLAADHSGNSAGVAAISQNEALLFTSPNNVDWASTDAPEFEVRPWSPPWEKTVGEQLTESKLTRVGFEPGSLSVKSFNLFTELFPLIQFSPLDHQIDRLRSVKEPAEIARIEQAIAITDLAFEQVVGVLRVGVTEREIATKIDELFLEFGADGSAFPSTAAFGPNSAKPHHRSGDRTLREGEAIIIDMGARLDGYCADLTRTLWLGNPESRLVEIYTTVKEAQSAAVSAVRAGVPAKEVDAAARRIIDGAGFADYFIHGVGHGLGIRVHDGPSLNSANEEPLSAGNVVTIEPGVYVREFGGVRIEDVAYVQEAGCRVLTRAPKDPAIT